MILRYRWRRYYFGGGREGWHLYVGDRMVGGVVRYRWGATCIGYIGAREGDRDVARTSTPGPAKSRVKAIARALLGYRTCSEASRRSAS